MRKSATAITGRVVAAHGLDILLPGPARSGFPTSSEEVPVSYGNDAQQMHGDADPGHPRAQLTSYCKGFGLEGPKTARSRGPSKRPSLRSTARMSGPKASCSQASRPKP